MRSVLSLLEDDIARRAECPSCGKQVMDYKFGTIKPPSDWSLWSLPRYGQKIQYEPRQNVVLNPTIDLFRLYIDWIGKEGLREKLPLALVAYTTLEVDSDGDPSVTASQMLNLPLQFGEGYLLTKDDKQTMVEISGLFGPYIMRQSRSKMPKDAPELTFKELFSFLPRDVSREHGRLTTRVFLALGTGEVNVLRKHFRRAIQRNPRRMGEVVASFVSGELLLQLNRDKAGIFQQFFGGQLDRARVSWQLKDIASITRLACSWMHRSRLLAERAVALMQKRVTLEEDEAVAGAADNLSFGIKREHAGRFKIITISSTVFDRAAQERAGFHDPDRHISRTNRLDWHEDVVEADAGAVLAKFGRAQTYEVHRFCLFYFMLGGKLCKENAPGLEGRLRAAVESEDYSSLDFCVPNIYHLHPPALEEYGTEDDYFCRDDPRLDVAAKEDEGNELVAADGSAANGGRAARVQARAARMEAHAAATFVVPLSEECIEAEQMERVDGDEYAADPSASVHGDDISLASGEYDSDFSLSNNESVGSNGDGTVDEGKAELCFEPDTGCDSLFDQAGQKTYVDAAMMMNLANSDGVDQVNEYFVRAPKIKEKIRLKKEKLERRDGQTEPKDFPVNHILCGYTLDGQPVEKVLIKRAAALKVGDHFFY